VPAIVPLAVHYENPTAWQSRVEVLVGEALRPEPHAALGAIHRLITGALESVGAYFASAGEQRLAESLAYAGTLGTPGVCRCPPATLILRHTWRAERTRDTNVQLLNTKRNRPPPSVTLTILGMPEQTGS